MEAHSNRDSMGGSKSSPQKVNWRGRREVGGSLDIDPGISYVLFGILGHRSPSEVSELEPAAAGHNPLSLLFIILLHRFLGKVPCVRATTSSSCLNFRRKKTPTAASTILPRVFKPVSNAASGLPAAPRPTIKHSEERARNQGGLRARLWLSYDFAGSLRFPPLSVGWSVSAQRHRLPQLAGWSCWRIAGRGRWLPRGSLCLPSDDKRLLPAVVDVEETRL